MLEKVTKELPGVLQKVKLKGKQSAMDFVDTFVSEFLKAMKTDSKSSGRRLMTFKKKLDLILKLPEGYEADTVVAWVNKNSDKVQAGLEMLMKQYKLNEAGFGTESV